MIIEYGNKQSSNATSGTAASTSHTQDHASAVQYYTIIPKMPIEIRGDAGYLEQKLYAVNLMGRWLTCGRMYKKATGIRGRYTVRRLSSTMGSRQA